MSKLRASLRRIKEVAKNLTFWSVILGFWLGYFMNSGEWFVNAVTANISLINTERAEYAKFVVLLIISLAFGLVFYFVERRQNDTNARDSQRTNRILKSIAKRMGVPENEYNDDESNE